MKDRHLNPKAACLKKREEEKAALRIGSCSTPAGPLTPTADQGPSSGCFTFEGLTAGDTIPLSLPPATSNQPPNASTHNPSGSISPSYYSNAGESAFHSTSPVGSFQYPIPCNPSPPPLTPTDKIPRIKSEPHMKKKQSNGSLSPTLRRARCGGRILSPVMGSSCNNSRTE